MRKNFFYRNIRARDLLDAFLVSAISSLLLVRFYLHVTGYPQIGGGALHIAHMLYGGIFMLLAIVICLTFLGIRARQTAAIIGGIGFGMFIDELGKFITQDNNYFFRPTIGIIYAIFVVLYLSFNFLSRSQRLSSREYQINALAELEEAVAHDMDKGEKARIQELLKKSRSSSLITQHLQVLVEALDVTASDQPSLMQRFLHKVDKQYKIFWQKRSSETLIGLLFVLEVVFLAAGTIYTIYNNIDDVKALFSGSPTYGEELLVGQVVTSVIAAGFVIYGISLLRISRREAFEQFRRATLINIYLVEFFIFVRLQFQALPGLILSIILLLLITFVLRQEKRLGGQ